MYDICNIYNIPDISNIFDIRNIGDIYNMCNMHDIYNICDINDNHNIYNMSNGKLLMACTMDEFIESLVYALGLSMRQDESVLDDKGGRQVKKHYVYGIKGLMALLGTSRTTASKLKNSGVLDDAMSQSGRITVFDADLVIALLNVKKKKRTTTSSSDKNKGKGKP